MGWTYSKELKSPEDVKRRVTTDSSLKVLGSAWGDRRNDFDGERALWVAFEFNEKSERPGEQFVCLFLVAQHGGRDPAWAKAWGYKDLDESMGPYRNDCPAEILDLVEQKPSQYANHEWRAKVRQQNPQLALV